MNLRLFKLIVRMVMYIIILEDVILTLYCGLLLNGTHIWITEYFCGHSVGGFIILFITSYLLRFCWLYRSILTHNFLIYTCIVLQREIGFGILLTPLRWIMFSVGIILICLMINKIFHGGIENCRAVSHRRRLENS